MIGIRYHRAARSHCFYTNHCHLYLFWRQPFNGARREGISSGLTIKHRLKPELWRHTTVRYARYSSFGYTGTVRHLEVTRHLSRNWKGERILKTKRYFRVKLCT